MRKIIVFQLLVLGLASGQLNFEGNPLTENTEYTAEESHFSSRTARLESATNIANHITEQPHRPNPTTQPPLVTETKKTPSNLPQPPQSFQNDIKQDQTISRQFTNSYDQSNSPDNSELALNHFLNSKTPEESRQSLDYYLQSRESPESRMSSPQSSLVNQQPMEMVPHVNQQVVSSPMNQPIVSSPVNQQLTQMMHQRQSFPVQRQNLQPSDIYDPLNQVQSISPGMPMMQPGIQARNDMFYPGWNRVRRVRGKLVPMLQQRVGPGLYNGPVPGPFKQPGPVEVIYTKPPGFHRGPPRLSNPPVPYEDAGNWFPEVDHPPPSKDIYYSQLYAQSYDPHYYNYIAKTGKIKPHLYGKLGKYHEDSGDGIWAELYRGFKKHGLKNMMTPTFLLGMTLPVVTLMLSALIQKRSFSRSDSREFSRENELQEYLERLQRAMECYEKKMRKKDTSGC